MLASKQCIALPTLPNLAQISMLSLEFMIWNWFIMFMFVLDGLCDYRSAWLRNIILLPNLVLFVQNPIDIIVDNIFLLLIDQNNVFESWTTLYYPHGPSNVLWIEFKFRIQFSIRNFFKPTKPGRGQGRIIFEAKNQFLKN